MLKYLAIVIGCIVGGAILASCSQLASSQMPRDKCYDCMAHHHDGNPH